MTDLAYVSDHTAQSLDLLIDAYRELPRLAGLVSAIVNRVQELETVAWDVTNKRLLDYTALDGTSAHAVAAQLDAIGRLVDQPRKGQSDATYLIYIRAKIFLNKSKARRGQIIQLIKLLESAAFSFTEFYPGTVVLTFVSAPATDPNVLLDIARKAVAGGVRIELVAPPNSVPAAQTFAFSHAGASSDPLRAFGHAGSSAYGGVFASAYG